MRVAVRLSDLCWAGVLLTLPWIGLGVAHLLTGRDLGAGLQPAYLLLPAALALAAAAPRGERLPGRWRRRDVVLTMLFLAAVALSAAGLVRHPGAAPPAERWARYGRQVAQLLLMGGFAAFAAAWTRGDRRWALTRRLLAAGVLVQAAYGAGQALHFAGRLSWFGALERWFTSNPAILSGSERLFLGGAFLAVPRLRGTACEPLYLGSYLLLALPLLRLPGSGRSERLALALGVPLLVLTWSRGAWLGAAAALAAWLLLRWRAGSGPALRPGRRLWIALAAGGAVLLVAAALAPDLVVLPLRRLAQSADRQDWSNLTRLFSMQAAWRAFRLSPLVGIGWGQFAFHFPLLVDPAGLQSQFTWPVVNNLPLKILCETGLVGAAVLVAAAALLGREVLAAVRPPAAGPEPAAVVRARRRLCLVAAANLGLWVQLLTFSQYNLPHLWVGGGLLLAALAEAGDGAAVAAAGASRAARVAGEVERA